MTGYLQRLVSTTVQGRTGVRPIVRPPMTWRGAGQPAWPEFAAGEAPSLAGDATPPAPVRDGPAPGGDRPGPPAGRTGAPPAAQPAQAPAPVPEMMTPLFGAAPAADPAAGPAAADPAAGAGRTARPLVTRRSPPPLAAGHASGPDHLAEPARSGPGPATARPRPAALPQVRRESRHWAGPPAPGRAGPAGRGDTAGPGDVEIHIGRIEVTAVSPPPAAPVPKAARKAINLDDYLRNRR